MEWTHTLMDVWAIPCAIRGVDTQADANHAINDQLT